MYTKVKAVTGYLLLVFGLAAAFEGAGIFTYSSPSLQGNEGVWLADFGTGDMTKLWGKNGSGAAGAAAFSPDGRQIIFASSGKLHIMDNNGGRQRILPLSAPCKPQYNLCWTTNGIFWAADSGVWRYEMQSNTLKQIHRWDDLISGKTKGYWCSMDGRKAWCWAELDDGTPDDTHGDQAFLTFNADWSLRSELRVPIWGHGNYMSHSGETLLFDKWSNPHSHRKIQLVRHADATPFDTLYPDLPETEEIAVFNSMNLCPNDSQLVMVITKSSVDTLGHCWVWNWVANSTPERVEKPAKANGQMMWKGPLPEVVLTQPWLSSDRNEFVYWPGRGHTESIPIMNTGGGTLGAVTVETAGGNWLNWWLEGAGDTQTVKIQPIRDSLPVDSTYKLILRISGGGAENVLEMPIYKVEGRRPMIPEPVDVYPTGGTDTDVLVTWTDRDSREGGFEIQRRTSASSWADVAAVDANVTSYTDVAPGYGTLFYRVRAVSDSGNSAYSDSVEVVVNGVPSVTVTAPAAGDNLSGGDTAYIEWTAHLITQVEIKYSLDGGDTWEMVSREGGVLQGTPQWGHYPWAVPDVSATDVLLWIHQYGTPDQGGYSALFSIGVTASAMVAAPPKAVVTALRSSPAFFHGGTGHRFAYSIAQGQQAWLQVVRLDGSLVARVTLSSAPGEHVAAWDGRDANGGNAGTGMFIARLVREGGTR